MLRLAWLSLLGLAVLPRPFCAQEELELNGSIRTADAARVPLPAWPPRALCGEAGGSDVDFWRIPLDFHTSTLCEGEALFTLEAEGPCRLTLLAPTGVGSSSPYELVGSWHSPVGTIATGSLGVVYYQRRFDHLIAVVQVDGAPEAYRLTYW